LSRAAGRNAARPALIFSTALILSIAAVLLVERLLIPHGII
jgi:hypothetical protein